MLIGDTFTARRTEVDGRVIQRLFTVDSITTTGLFKVTSKKLIIKETKDVLIATDMAATFKKDTTGKIKDSARAARGKPTPWEFIDFYVDTNVYTPGGAAPAAEKKKFKATFFFAEDNLLTEGTFGIDSLDEMKALLLGHPKINDIYRIVIDIPTVN